VQYKRLPHLWANMDFFCIASELLDQFIAVRYAVSLLKLVAKNDFYLRRSILMADVNFHAHLLPDILNRFHQVSVTN
jgi:hypothetical protein